ncbi:MAG: PKD domain-containing protein, partial [Bryobacteraceae bacterium]|nr:PKD domain-containing protein [Bryobacteraceae bacterium]
MRLFPGTSLFAVTLLAVGISTNAYAVVPVIKTVRAAAADPLRPHPGYPGKTLILKATANAGGAPMSYDWDFGDGSPHVTGPVSDPYIVEATHSYGSIGSFTAILKVTNTSTAEFAIANYSIQVSAKTLATEVNIAIEDGLWYLHKTMGRSTVTGTPYGTWFQCPKGGSACAFYPAIDPQNIQAFEVVGFLESGSPQDPYTETVSRAMKAVLNGLGSSPIPNTKTLFTNPALTTTVTVNPDTNGNGLSVGPNSSQQIYQGGMFLDALVAANNPAKVVDFGPLVGGGRTYLQTIQDMVDFYANCQDEGGNDGFSSRPGGGWRYDCNGGADNSVNQWGAIGMIAAEQTPGVAHSAPAGSKLANLNGWLAYSQDTSSGIFGYDTSSSIWGPYATTPSGMVQLVWDEVGRGDTRWDKAESFIR